MKKFFIILCGILVMGDAFGVVVLRDRQKDWGYEGSYTKDESSNSTSNSDAFASSWQLNSDNGTFGQDEGSIVAIVARQIWKNGGKFCVTQIQHANAGGDFNITYHSKGSYACADVCKSEYSGDKCETHQVSDCLTDEDYTKKFNHVINDDALRILSGGNASLIRDNNEMMLLDSKDKSSSDKDSYDWVLGVVKVRPHSLTVVPIEIHANAKNRNKSWIESVKSNKNYTVLCAPGYILNNTKDDCEPSTKCRSTSMLNQLCPEYLKTEYSADIHVLTEKIGDCYKFKCVAIGYGFKSVNDRQTCVECEGGALAYIKDDGTCGKCEKGKIANETRDDCINEGRVKQYSREQMKSNDELQCWLETDARKFLGCVKGRCSGTEPCWDKNHGCKACD